MFKENMGNISDSEESPKSELGPQDKIIEAQTENIPPTPQEEIEPQAEILDSIETKQEPPRQDQRIVEELERTRIAMEYLASIMSRWTEVNTREVINQAILPPETNKGERADSETIGTELATEIPSETMDKLGEKIANAIGLKSSELPPPKGLKEKTSITDQRKWIWEMIERIAQTGTRFGASENYADALALSQARSFLDPELLKEIDSLTLMYNQFVNFANAPGLSEAEQLTSSIRGEHFNTLMQRPEIMKSFRLWEKYAQAKGVRGKETESILVAKGQKLAKQRENLRNELITELSSSDSYEYKNPEDLLLAATVGLQFGEFLWRSSERAAALDTTLGGSGEYFLRRLLHGKEAVEKDIKDGRSKAKPEIARKLNYGVVDWYSSLGEKFWLGEKNDQTGQYDSPVQPSEVVAWYLRMKREGKIGEKGEILDLSECPLDKVDFLAGSTNPNSGIMIAHYSIQLIGAEKTRTALTEPGAFLEAPTIENFMKLKGLFSNLNFYTDKSLKEQEDKLKANKEAKENENLEDIATISIFRQEAYKEIFDGMVDYLLNHKLVSRETIAGYVEVASTKEGGLFEEKERQEEMKKLFRLPYWLEIPLRRINYIGGILALLWATLKASFSQK